MSFVQLKNLNMIYNQKNHILKDLNLDIEKGELVSLLGPSGCGKTTTLRIVAGLLEATSGTFELDGTEMLKVPVHKRHFGMVFQSYALFPHLTIFDNVAFGLKIQKEDKEAISKKVMAMLEVCGLQGLEQRFPKELSGGQRQRVALARALVIEPKLLLLDEPLSNLDAKLRVQMRLEIKRIQQELKLTTLFVTHDQEECFSISDKVAVMNNGVIEQYGTPEEIYHHPKTEFVARFIGFENFMKAKRYRNQQYQLKDGTLVDVPSAESADNAILSIRPEHIEIVSTDSAINGEVLIRTFLGKAYQYEVATNVGTLLVNSSEHYEAGERIALRFPLDKLVVLTK